MKLAECRRVVLFDFDEETKQIEFRHYSINVKLTGVSKTIKNLISANLEDLENFNDVSDYILKASLLSESDVEDAGESTVTLPEKYVGKGNAKSEERAIRLMELGPRMSLSVNKIVSNLMSGDVLYHSYISKTREEVKILEKNRKEKEEIKAQRRAVQEANVKAKALKNKKDDSIDPEASGSEEHSESHEFGSGSDSDIEEAILSENE
jgi:ribosome biogenesis protein SSF1/2